MDCFSCELKVDSKETRILFTTSDPAKVKTGSYPRTLEVLQKKLSSILECKCFNDKGLPFKVEVLDTELGHLYEHILLEYLADLKYEKSRKPVKVTGVTMWDWENNPKGSFEIKISTGVEDEELLKEAVAKTDRLIREIIQPFSQSQDVLAL